LSTLELLSVVIRMFFEPLWLGRAVEGSSTVHAIGVEASTAAETVFVVVVEVLASDRLPNVEL
jgi:hypothetical protein